MSERRMRFGVILQGVDSPERFVELARLAEEAGCEFLWVTDSSLHARYVYIYLTLAAINTKRLKLGPCVTHPYTRHPAMTANAIATLDQVSGGRAILGLGSGDRPVTELGYAPAPVGVVRQQVEASRRLWAGECLDLKSESFSLHDAELHFPARPDIPVYLAATGPRMLQLAGEVADGAIMMASAHPAGVGFALEQVREGMRLGDRGRHEVDIAFSAGCCIAPRQEDALAGARTMAAWFGQTAPRYARLIGASDALIGAIQQAYAGGELHEARDAAALATDEMVDALAVAGTWEHCLERFQQMQEFGLDHVELFLVGPDREQTIRYLGERIIPALR